MNALAILNVLLQTVPAALDAFTRIKGTLSEADLAALDRELAAADASVTVDHDTLAAAIAAAKAG